MESDSATTGIIYPYCKGCKRNIPIMLCGNGTYICYDKPYNVNAKCL